MITPGRLSGFGLAVPPLAFAAYHVVGLWLTETRCNIGGGRYDLDGWTIAAAAAAEVMIVAGLAASIVAFRRTRDAGDEPPASRVHFLSIMGMTVAPLVLVIVAMQGLGVVFLDPCVQS